MGRIKEKENKQLTLAEALERLGPKRLFGDMRILEERRVLRYFRIEGGQDTPVSVGGVEFTLEIDGKKHHFVGTCRSDDQGRISLKDTMIFHRLPGEEED